MDGKMFEYQKLDIQISKLEKEKNVNEYTKAMDKSKATFKSLQEKTDNLGKDAEKQLVYFSGMKNSLENLEKEFAIIESVEATEDSDKKMKAIVEKIKRLQGNLLVLKENIEKITALYEDAKTKVIEAKKEHKVAKEKQEQKAKELDEKISIIKEDMQQMAKSLDSVLLKKYNECKADNILPVFVYATADNACGGCMQKIAINELSKLNQDKKIVCEYCRRIIIKE